MKARKEKKANQSAFKKIKQTNAIPNSDGLPGFDSLQPGRRMVWCIGTESTGNLTCIFWGVRKCKEEDTTRVVCSSLGIFGQLFGFTALENRGKGGFEANR